MARRKIIHIKIGNIFKRRNILGFFVRLNDFGEILYKACNHTHMGFKHGLSVTEAS